MNFLCINVGCGAAPLLGAPVAAAEAAEGNRCTAHCTALHSGRGGGTKFWIIKGPLKSIFVFIARL